MCFFCCDVPYPVYRLYSSVIFFLCGWFTVQGQDDARIQERLCATQGKILRIKAILFLTALINECILCMLGWVSGLHYFFEGFHMFWALFSWVQYNTSHVLLFEKVCFISAIFLSHKKLVYYTQYLAFSILYINCLICWPNLKGVDSYLQTYPQLHGFMDFFSFLSVGVGSTASFQYWVCPLDGSSCSVFFCLGDLFYYFLDGEERRNPNAAGFWRNYQVLYLTWEKPTEGRI